MRNSSLRVLAYHRVIEPQNDYASNPSLVSATPIAFEQQVQYLVERYTVV